MARKEFTQKTKRQAWERSGGACEADGDAYGLGHGVRCGADMTVRGVNYDHIDPDANSKDASIENCCACCPRCHNWKTRNRDAPLIAKTDSQANMAAKIKPKWHRPMPGSRKSGFRRRMNGQVERRP
jgi:hypothetical protein